MIDGFRWWADGWEQKDGAYVYNGEPLWVYANFTWFRLDSGGSDMSKDIRVKLEVQLLDMLNFGDCLTRMFSLRGLTMLTTEDKLTEESRSNFYSSLHQMLDYGLYQFDIDQDGGDGVGLWNEVIWSVFVKSIDEYVSDLHRWREAQELKIKNSLPTMANMLDKMKWMSGSKPVVKRDEKEIWLELVDKIEVQSKVTHKIAAKARAKPSKPKKQ